MKRQFIDTLQDGDTVNDYFLAVRKDLRDTQNGGKFLGLVFRDRTGEIGGIHWTNPVGVAGVFELGDVVNVRGRVQTYQDRLQLKVDQVLPLREGEYALEDIIESQLDVTKTLADFDAILNTIENKWLKHLVQSFRSDAAFMERFTVSAAGKRWHHSYRGGLLEHCLEMAQLVQGVCAVYAVLDRDLLLTAVFLHDVGKLDELSQDLAVDYTNAGKLLGHLVIGSQMVQDRINQIKGFPENLRLHLHHLILSHHGTLENGSPVVPKSREALALNRIDDLGAQMNAWGRIIEETRNRKTNWSDYVGLIGQQIWTTDD